MRRRATTLLVLFGCAGSSPPPLTPSAPPPPSTPGAPPGAAPLRPAVTVDPPSAPAPESTIAAATRSRPWPTRATATRALDALPRTRDFVRVEALPPSDLLALTWRELPPEVIPGSEAFPEYQRRVELVLTSGGVSRVIDLGKHKGGMEGVASSVCTRRGYRLPGFPREEPVPTSQVATWEIAATVGSATYELVLGPGTLYLLETLTHDGLCPGAALADGGCAEVPRRRLAEIPLRGTPSVVEEAVHMDAPGAAPEPCDCKGSYLGSTMLGPDE